MDLKVVDQQLLINDEWLRLNFACFLCFFKQQDQNSQTLWHCSRVDIQYSTESPMTKLYQTPSYVYSIFVDHVYAYIALLHLQMKFYIFVSDIV